MHRVISLRIPSIIANFVKNDRQQFQKILIQFPSNPMFSFIYF